MTFVDKKWNFFPPSILLQVFAFVAPKIIGGRNAPSPVGELGMVEMSQALDLLDVCYEQVPFFRYVTCSFSSSFGIKYIAGGWTLPLTI